MNITNDNNAPAGAESRSVDISDSEVDDEVPRAPTPTTVMTSMTAAVAIAPTLKLNAMARAKWSQQRSNAR